MRLLRSLLFQAAFYGTTTFYLLVFLPLLPVLSRKAMWRVGVMTWVATNTVLLRLIVGTRAEFRGVENIPDGPLLIAAKHQSAWETFALLPLFSDPAFILKKELMRIPVFGWFAAKQRMIPVDRAGGRSALADMVRTAAAETATGRQVLIFPEGTRRPPGAPPAYKPGIAFLYDQLKVPCLPVALNAGLYWPRRSLQHRPGTILVEFLPVLPPGLPRAAFLSRLEADIEDASNRLLQEGLDALGADAPQTVAAEGKSSQLSTPVENS